VKWLAVAFMNAGKAPRGEVVEGNAIGSLDFRPE